MTDLNQRIANLSPEKRALLEQRLMQQRSPIAPPPTIPLRDRAQPCPASFPQAALWFLDQLQSNSAAYNIADAQRIEGTLAVDALQAALNAVVDRHEALRTTFQLLDGNLIQVVRDRQQVELSVVDLTADAGDETKLQECLRAAAQQPFNLEKDGMLRATLVQVAESVQVLLLVVHHIASDGWSIALLWDQLATFYTAFTTQTPANLPALPIQYADFACWQRQRLQGEFLQTQLDYWTKQLAGELPVLELPSDRPRPAVQTFQGARLPVTIPLALTNSLRQLSQQAGATLFMTLLTAFKVLLHRYSHQDDILVGYPIANRTQVETEKMIGFFVNTLVLRTNLAGNPPFLQLLQQVRQTALSAYTHQDLPFEKLVEMLQPERTLSHTPIFQSLFVLQNTPATTLKLGNFSLTPMPIDNGTAKSDVSLSLDETSRGLEGTIEYNTDLFDAATMQGFVRHFQMLLAGIAANPNQAIAAFPLLTPTERQELLVQWNQTQTSFPTTPLHQLFEAQVARSPAAIALVDEFQTLTYGELNQKANQLAHHLQTLGVGKETLVGICLERSSDLIISILAILKAGGAYVPLDPNYPVDRLAFMLADTQVPVLLTHTEFVDRFADDTIQVLCLDSDWDAIAHHSRANLPTSITGDSLAYVLYTSGSTGTTKGILIPHLAINRLVINTNYVNFQPTDAIAHASSCSFDAATFEIWGALLHGAKLVIIPRAVLLSPPEFAAALQQQQITVLFLTTALFNQLANAIPTAFAGLRYLLFGGEAADPRWVNHILQHQPPQHLVNGYGPTENTTFSTCYTVQSVAENASMIPIGTAIANTQLYVLDRQMEPVPVGVPGELYLGGAGVARGYLNRPELTAERFIPNPFVVIDPAASTHLYKTGDRVRYLSDRSLEFLGRIDNQVKIRGFRIEPGEIEVALGKLAMVQDAVVVVQEQAGEKQLVAYVVPHARETTPDQVRSSVQQSLPAYMIPRAFVLLESLPLTANGKVDRRALPAPTLVQMASTPSEAAPPDNLELRLIKLWEEILGVQPITVDGHFFDLGGHSLMAVRLLSAIGEQFGQTLPVSALFQAPTVRQFAHVLRQKGWSSPWSLLVPIQSKGNKPPFFCVPGGDGNVLFFGDLMRQFDADQPFYGIQAQGIDGDRPVLNRIEAIAAANLRELRAFQPQGPYFLGGHSTGGLVAFEMAQQLVAAGQTVGLLALLEPSIPGSSLFRLPFLKQFNYLAALPFLHYLIAQLNHLTYRIEGALGGKIQDDRPQKVLQVSRIMTRIMSGFRADWSQPNAHPAKPDPTATAIWAANTEAMLRYVPRPYSQPIALFLCHETLTQSKALSHWQVLAGDQLEIHRVPGNHKTALQAPHVAVLVQQLTECLQRSQSC